MTNRHLFIFITILLYAYTFSGFYAFAQNETKEMKEWLEDNVEAIKQNDTARIIKNYKYIGDGYSELENFSKSNYYLKEGLKWSIKAKAHKETGSIYNLLANNASYDGDREAAMNYYLKSLEAYKKINNMPKMAMIQMNIGTEYSQIGDYKKAIEWELKSLETKEKSGDIENLGYFYQKVGELFKDIDIKKWEYYVNKAYSLKNIENAVKPRTLIAIYNDLGGIAHKKRKYDMSYAWYDSMLQLSKEYEYESGMSTSLSNRSLVYQEEKKYDEALKDILESLKISESTGRKFSIITDNIHAASILLDLNRAEEAGKHCKKALKTAVSEGGYYELETDAHRLLAKIEEKNGNWQNAYFHLKKYKEGTDSIKNTEVQKTIEELETKYQTVEKEQKIKILDKDNQIKNLKLTRIRILIIILLVLSLTIAGIIYLYFRNKQIKHIQLQSELKQKLLRAQMNPHFTFNTLNAINHYIQNKEVRQASDYLAQYSKLMRQILEHSSVEQIALIDEINFLNNYLSMQKLRFNNSFDFEILSNINPEMQEDIEIPPMITQPFVENSVEHGIRGMSQGGKITITFETAESNLIISITDNGKGIYNNEKKDEKSFAMKITRERLLIKSGDSKSLQVQSPVEGINCGTRIIVRIPLKQNN